MGLAACRPGDAVAVFGEWRGEGQSAEKALFDSPRRHPIAPLFFFARERVAVGPLQMHVDCSRGTFLLKGVSSARGSKSGRLVAHKGPLSPSSNHHPPSRHARKGAGDQGLARGFSYPPLTPTLQSEGEGKKIEPSMMAIIASPHVPTSERSWPHVGLFAAVRVKNARRSRRIKGHQKILTK